MRHQVLSRVRALTALAIYAGTFGCGPAAPVPPEQPEPAATELPPEPVASSAPSAEPPPPSIPPHVTVLGVLPSAESIPYKRVQILFENDNEAPCRIERYVVSWGSFNKRIDVDDFEVPGGQSRERRTRIHPADGELDELTEDAVTVSVDEGCVGGDAE